MIPDIAGSETMYRLDGLEEGTEYSITVTATLTGGGSQQDMAVGTTVATGECNSHIAIYSDPLFLSITLSFSSTTHCVCLIFLHNTSIIY